MNLTGPVLLIIIKKILKNGFLRYTLVTSNNNVGKKLKQDFFNMVCKLDNISEDMQQVNKAIGTCFISL